MNNLKTTEFLSKCKKLYQLSIHPFDFKKAAHLAYEQNIGLGKDLIKEIGLQNFAGFIVEPQYRIAIWSSMITLEYGKPEPDEILEVSTTNTVISVCLEIIGQDEIPGLPTEIIRNKTVWIERMKTCYNI